VSQPDAKWIARQWDREIEEETKRLDARKQPGPWRAVVWVVLWVLWLTGVMAAIGFFHRLQ